MTTILVFTKNFAIRQAIISIYAEDRAIFFFDNRLAFLVCATVLDKSYIIIDTIHESGETIRWLYSQLATRISVDFVYFIVPEAVAQNIFLRPFLFIATVKSLREICDYAAKIDVSDGTGSLKKVLYKNLEKRLSKNIMNYLMNIYDTRQNCYIRKEKSDLNRLYYLRRRLHLRRKLEMTQLISMLASNDIG